MKKKKLLIAVVLGCIAIVQMGCTSYWYTSRSTKVNRIDINSSEQVADITVNYQKTVTAVSDFQKVQSAAKNQAVYQCIMDNDIDVLVDPIFQVEKRGLSGYRATVYGFAGYYKVGKDELEKMVEKRYSKEDVEKYLLLTDPTFYQYYYKTEGNGNVYNIKCDTKTANTSVLKQQIKNENLIKKAEKKTKKREDKKEKRQRRLFNLFSVSEL